MLLRLSVNTFFRVENLFSHVAVEAPNVSAHFIAESGGEIKYFLHGKQNAASASTEYSNHSRVVYHDKQMIDSKGEEENVLT